MKITHYFKNMIIKTSILPCCNPAAFTTILPTAPTRKLLHGRQSLLQGQYSKTLKLTDIKTIEKYRNFRIQKTNNCSLADIAKTKEIQQPKIQIPQRIFRANCNPGAATITTTSLYSSSRGAFAQLDNSNLFINTFLLMKKN